jgi:hypothetical protein
MLCARQAADEIERLKAERDTAGQMLGNAMGLLAEQRDEIADLKQAIKQGQREAAEHILEMWRDPWPRTERSFIDRLEAYVEELK